VCVCVCVLIACVCVDCVCVCVCSGEVEERAVCAVEEGVGVWCGAKGDWYY